MEQVKFKPGDKIKLKNSRVYCREREVVALVTEDTITYKFRDNSEDGWCFAHGSPSMFELVEEPIFSMSKDDQ